MSRSFKIQKYKLMKILGQEIWGSLLCKYSNLYTRFYKLHFRNVCNYIILEYERRILFDFQYRYKNSFISKTAIAFKEKRRTFEFSKNRGIKQHGQHKPLQYFARSNIGYWIYRNGYNLYPTPAFPFFSSRFLGYGTLLFALIKIWENRRKKFNKRFVSFNSKNKKAKKFNSKNKFKSITSRRFVSSYMKSIQHRRRYSSFIGKPFKKPFKKFKSYNKKYNKSFKPFKPTVSVKAFKKAVKNRSKTFVFLRKGRRTFVFRSTTPYIPWKLRRRYTYWRRRYSNRWPKARFFSWARCFLSRTKTIYGLPRVASSILNKKSFYKNKPAWSTIKDLNRTVKKSSFRKRPSLVFIQYLAHCWKTKFPFSNKLFKRFSTKIRISQNTNFNSIQKKIYLSANTNQFYSIPKFIDSFLFESPVSATNNLPVLTIRYLFRPSIFFDEFPFTQQDVELTLRPNTLYVATRSTSKILTSLGDIRRKLQDRKEIIFVLNYSTKKLKLGDYEDGFRIPRPLRGSSKRRNKKQFRLLNLYRYRTFYGIFDLKSFGLEYSKLFKSKQSIFLNLFQFLECRVSFILQLSGLFPSMYFIDCFIKHKNLLINKKLVVNPHRFLHINEDLFLPISYYWSSINTLIFKLTHFRLLLNIPRFIEFNRTVLAMRLVSYPKNHERTLPFSGVHSTFDPSSILRSEI